ncbi:hypothetical protein BC829DRAFT_388330 [Chytridium lagenaria]|nr:hypothetical protein BC829DRAFT_388330 [Chytridium lagenaria]
MTANEFALAAAELEAPLSATSLPSNSPETLYIKTASSMKGKEPVTAENAEMSKLEDVEELKQEAINHIAEGKKAFALANYEGAVEEFAAASDILASVFGANAPECADVLYSYGVALFNNAVSKSSPLGGTVSTNEVTESLEAQLVSHKDASRFVFSGDADEEEGESSAPEAAGGSSSSEAQADAGADHGDDNDDAEDGEDEDGMAEDMQIAWETLDLARVIFLKMGESKKMKVADVLLGLGDVSLELGQWASAIEDFSEAIPTVNSLKPITSLHSHMNFQKTLKPLSTTHPLLSKFLKKKLKTLRAIEGGADEVKNEITDIEGLMPDIKAKVDELKNEMKEAAASKLKEAEKASSSSLSAETSNVSGLVRKKAKVEAMGDDDAGNGKKAKVDMVSDS